jgi:hypothetical protein
MGVPMLLSNWFSSVYEFLIFDVSDFFVKNEQWIVRKWTRKKGFP